MPNVPDIIKQGMRLALTVGALVVIGVYVDLSAVIDTLRRGSVPLLILASVLVIPNVILDATTWRDVLAPMLLKASASEDAARVERASASKRASVLESETGIQSASVSGRELDSGTELHLEKRDAPRETRNARSGEFNTPTSTLKKRGLPQRGLPQRRLPLRLVIASVLAGYTAAFFTPARVGEFGGRALTLGPAPSDGFDGWDVSITVGVQRMIDTLVAVSFGWIATAWVSASGVLSPAWEEAAIVALGIGGAVGAVLAATIARPGWIGSVLRVLAPSAAGVHKRADLLRRLGGRTVLRVTAGCAGRYLVFATQLAVLVAAFAPDASALSLALAAGVTYYVKMLIPSLTFLDVGVREGAAILAFGWMGVPEEAALNAALVIFFVNLALPAAVGAFFLKRQTVPEPSAQAAT